MSKFLTEDEVRDSDKVSLGFNAEEKGVQQGTGQLTTFNQLGIKGIFNKPDVGIFLIIKMMLLYFLKLKTAMKM